ncbi:MAG: alkaline phosphatase family protein [Frankiaceae bacterium]
MTGRRGDLLVIGLDGVPHWLLRELADAGVMPETAALLPQGSLRPLRAPIPDISSTSWASFLTGSECGRHGIYGFVDLVPGTYDTYFPNMRHLQGTPVWEPVAAGGGRSLIVNVPGTYPAPSTVGSLVSGFVAPDFARAVWPAHHREPLLRRGYQLDVEVGDVAGDAAGFLDRVDETLAGRRHGLSYLLDQESDAELVVCVFTETDRIHHFLWRDLMDAESPLHARILDIYGRLDQAIGELARRAGDGGLMLVSDHGFGSVSTQFCVNAWLRETGYLALPATASGLDEIDARTVAFALDPGRIFLNRRPRFPRGHELPVESLLEEISAGLLALRRRPDGEIVPSGDGDPVVAEVLRGSDIYAGPCSEMAPDLVVVAAPDVQVRGTWATDALVIDSPLTGTHTRHDALLWCRGDLADGTADMRDVAPTMLAELGLVPPATMDGLDARRIRTLTTSSLGS